MWVRFLGRVPPGIPEILANLLERAGIGLTFPTGAVEGFGAVVFEQVDDTVSTNRGPAPRAQQCSPLHWPAAEPGAAMGAVARRRQGRAGLAPAAGRRRPGRSRLDRWSTVEGLADSAEVKRVLVGRSRAGASVVRSGRRGGGVLAGPVLVIGESGTGKELVARADPRARPGGTRATSLSSTARPSSPELSGSELFGHERGAFTGATDAATARSRWPMAAPCSSTRSASCRWPCRPSCCAPSRSAPTSGSAATPGSAPISAWCAPPTVTYAADMAAGRFRADLYYRIAGWLAARRRCASGRRTSLPLARHFLSPARRRRTRALNRRGRARVPARRATIPAMCATCGRIVARCICGMPAAGLSRSATCRRRNARNGRAGCQLARRRPRDRQSAMRRGGGEPEGDQSCRHRRRRSSWHSSASRGTCGVRPHAWA